MVNQTLESPRQNKLDHDVTAILGSSDPPPGFGFLHPRFYYLEQKRPIPLEPLQVSVSLFFYMNGRIVEKKRREITLYSSVTSNPFFYYAQKKYFFTSDFFFVSNNQLKMFHFKHVHFYFLFNFNTKNF